MVSEPLTPTELRHQLIEAASSGSRKKLRSLCMQHKDQIAANVGIMTTAPEEIRSDAGAIEKYIQCLGAVAQCLANECGAPELWNKLCGTEDSNPLLKWDRWYKSLPERAERLEYTSLIAEARQFIAEAKRLEGRAARQNEAFLYGRLGGLLFHSGKVADAVEPYENALDICRQLSDFEGQRIHLGNLLEAYRYLGNLDAAVSVGEEAVKLSNEQQLDCESLQRQLRQIRRGEPLCRVVCHRDGKELELDEIKPLSEGRFEFVFRRNRLSLQMVTTLVKQGMTLATSGQLADALEKFGQAAEVDPHDPDPVYQNGICLMDMGLYSKAKDAFDEVERLAPGWFRCRTDRWLAESLESGTITDDEFHMLRVLQDGNLVSDEAIKIANAAIERFPDFAPLYLILGDLNRDQGKKDGAMDCYRKGIALVAEPDLESRLLCAAAGVLPVESTERRELVLRALKLKGSLVAQSTAVVMGIAASNAH